VISLRDQIFTDLNNLHYKEWLDRFADISRLECADRFSNGVGHIIGRPQCIQFVIARARSFVIGILSDQLHEIHATADRGCQLVSLSLGVIFRQRLLATIFAGTAKRDVDRFQPDLHPRRRQGLVPQPGVPGRRAGGIGARTQLLGGGPLYRAAVPQVK
jgi:hypothetical protein